MRKCAVGEEDKHGKNFLLSSLSWTDLGTRCSFCNLLSAQQKGPWPSGEGRGLTSQGGPICRIGMRSQPARVTASSQPRSLIQILPVMELWFPSPLAWLRHLPLFQNPKGKTARCYRSALESLLWASTVITIVTIVYLHPGMALPLGHFPPGAQGSCPGLPI